MYSTSAVIPQRYLDASTNPSQRESSLKFTKAYAKTTIWDSPSPRKSSYKAILTNNEETCIRVAKKCDKCQRFSNMPRHLPTSGVHYHRSATLRQMGVDIIDNLRRASKQYKYAIIIIQHFTKWVEAKPLAKIIKANTTNFI